MRYLPQGSSHCGESRRDNMGSDTDATATSAQRIGILFSNTERLQVPALRYLLLELNSVQKHFEYELLPNDMPESPLEVLNNDLRGIERIHLRDFEAPKFLIAYKEYLRNVSSRHGLQEEPPNFFILITMATFIDNYYSTSPEFELTDPNSIAILALGNWEREMAPPSILECILTMTIQVSTEFVSPSFRHSIHLGTKGCICDFNANPKDTKFKVLNGYLCTSCRAVLVKDGLSDLADDIPRILSKGWLGTRSDPGSAAGILAHLKYDLFVTKGLSPTLWERFQKTLAEDGTKQVLDLVGKIILALVLLYLSLHGIKLKQ
jgi:hypothetical protein